MTDVHPPLSQPLADSDIHVWCAALSVSLQKLSHYASLLSHDETERARRFHFERDRSRYIVGRGILRTLLGNYLGLEPSYFEFVYGPHGKPALKSRHTDNTLEFNLSHSHDYALYVFNWNHRIGVDLEYRIALADLDDFAERYFTLHESTLINTLTGESKYDTFFKTWVCKEAFLKANGSGLTVPINQVEVSFVADGTVKLNYIDDNQLQTIPWRIEMFNPLPGYQAALAVEGQAGQLFFHQIESRFA